MTTKNADIKLSKLLSWLLRHGASSEGLTLSEDGYLDIELVLQLKQFRRYKFSDIQKVVETNDKKRFSLRQRDGKYQIRANQGHTLHVNEDYLLTELSEESIPEQVIHGTYLNNWEIIKIEGLSRMKRNHIHFTSGLPGDSQVISGMRKNCDIYIFIDAKKALKNGIKFYKSENEVILSPGNENGIIHPSFFKEIWQVKPKQLLYKNESV